MSLRRFATDKRLWVFISLALFLVPSFTLRIGKGGEMCPASLWILLFQYPEHFFEIAAFTFVWAVILGIPALSIGWVLHCLVVMTREALRRRPHEA